jgi:hypothetical protein
MRVDPAGRVRLPQRYPFFVQLLDAVRAVPGRAVGGPDDQSALDRNMGWDAVLPGRPYDPVSDSAFGRIVSPGYFETIGIRVVAGRDFDTRDIRSAQAVVAINETLAAQLDRAAAGSTGIAPGGERNRAPRRRCRGRREARRARQAVGARSVRAAGQAPSFFDAFDLVVRAERPSALLPAIRDAIWRWTRTRRSAHPSNCRRSWIAACARSGC